MRIGDQRLRGACEDAAQRGGGHERTCLDDCCDDVRGSFEIHPENMGALGDGGRKVFSRNACDVFEEFDSGRMFGLWAVEDLWCISDGTGDLTCIKVKVICKVSGCGSGKLAKVGNLNETRIAG